MRGSIQAFIASMIISLLTSCGGMVVKGGVQTKIPPRKKLSRYDNIVVMVFSQDTRLKPFKATLQREIKSVIQGSQLYDRVLTGGNRNTLNRLQKPLWLKLTLSDYRTPEGSSRGPAQFIVSGKLVDGSTKRLVSSFTATGNSLTKDQTVFGNSRVSPFIGGDGLSHQTRALRMAASFVLDYIKDYQ